uniref:Reverse transcriptase domain-containing protein n=1 Tax=Arion vulgaris TaxID=1028688 RepID=A0A0B6ZH55_9EUPU
MFSWIKDFLFHRSARVGMDNHFNRFFKLREGIPKGSVIAPILFLIDIGNIIRYRHQHISNGQHPEDFTILAEETLATRAFYLVQKTIEKVEN